jgi:inhibitor of KinA
MQIMPRRIIPLGECSVVVEFGNDISLELNSSAIALADYLAASPFPGFIEAVPAYSSTAIYYDAVSVIRSYEVGVSAFKRVRAFINEALSNLSVKEPAESDIVEIPTDFGPSAGPDLSFVADLHGLSTAEVIAIFTAQTYRVFMIGFLPGFAYMGEVDHRIQTPRRDQPRAKVPKRSVGIAGTQTGVYPLESPGGWQIVGRTSIEMFLPELDPPSRLKPGDKVRFVAI